MPLYEYECASHGPFDATVPMIDCRQAQPCPRCQGVSPRVILTAAALAAMPAPLRSAHRVNETSQHQPKTSAQFKHGAGCGCCKVTSDANVNRGFPARRPWMISH